MNLGFKIPFLVFTAAFLVSSPGFSNERNPMMDGIYDFKMESLPKAEGSFDYVLPIKEIPGPLTSLDFTWSDLTQNITVSVSQSFDLKSWSPLALQAELQPNKRYVKLPLPSAPYLGLKIEKNPGNVTLTKLQAEYVAFGAPYFMQWKLTPGSLSSNAPRTYVFDLGEELPVERIEVLSPPSMGNGSLYGELFAADDAQGTNKHLLYSGIFHRLSQSKVGPIRPASGKLFATKRYWLLTLEDHVPNLGQEVPELRVGWVPSQYTGTTRDEGNIFKNWFQRFSWVQILGAALALSAMAFFLVRRR